MIAGLTGGIGSGKSVVARLFSMMGAAVFDSDRAAKQAYLLPDIKAKVIDLLGAEAYTTGGQINSSFISSKIFSEPELLKGINSIIHPSVGQMFKEFTGKHSHELIIKESALLFEAGISGNLDQIIVVSAPDGERIRRVMERDHLRREVVEQKIKNQLPQEKKVKLADHVIINDGSRLLIPQVERIFMLLSNDTEGLSRKTI